MSRIVRRAAANQDLDALWDYIAQYDLSAADRVIDRIEARLTLLAEHPRLGAEYNSPRPGLRSFTIPPYQIFYQPIPDGIRLVRVLHGARDTGTVLRED